MNTNQLTFEVYSSLWTMFVVTAPFLIAALVVGLVIGLVQAVTQVQDQTLPQLIKIVLLLLMLVAMGSWISTPMLDQSRRLFTNFPVWVR